MDQKELPVLPKGEYLIREVVNFIFGKQPFNKLAKVVFVRFASCSSSVHSPIVIGAQSHLDLNSRRMQGFTQISLQYWGDILYSLYDTGQARYETRWFTPGGLSALNLLPQFFHAFVKKQNKAKQKASWFLAAA